MKKYLLGMVLASGVSVGHAETVKIYAAASLANAISDIAKRYEQQHADINIVPVFTASSTLAKQIQAGAGSDLFFSADVEWMNYLVEKGMIDDKQVQPLLFNQLVAISPTNISVKFQPKAQFNFAQAFKGHLCTGQMQSVPAGKYAKQSLTKLNWLNDLRGRIVETDSVRSALAFVERGECEVGIVYRTDALISKKVRIIGTFPDASHHPIVYPLALTKQGQQRIAAIQFAKFIEHDPQAKNILQHYGFKIKPSL